MIIKFYQILTVEEILIKSGNIGSVRIAQMLEIEGLRSFLTKNWCFK